MVNPFPAYFGQTKFPISYQDSILPNVVATLRAMHTSDLPESYKTNRVFLATHEFFTSTVVETVQTRQNMPQIEAKPLTSAFTLVHDPPTDSPKWITRGKFSPILRQTLTPYPTSRKNFNHTLYPITAT
jgi:hypothetical protein